jgi:hypothetical protein
LRDKHWIAALFSVFMVGLGQVIKGEGKKGLILILVFYFVLPALVFLSLAINDYLFLIVLSLVILSEIGLWLYNIGDAFLHAALV